MHKALVYKTKYLIPLTILWGRYFCYHPLTIGENIEAGLFAKDVTVYE